MYINLLNVHISTERGGRNSEFHFTEKKTEAQRREGNPPQSHCWQVEPGQVGSIFASPWISECLSRHQATIPRKMLGQESETRPVVDS